ncbi:hypothetical protein FHETE_5811 [Fusarium heterosporum]|uniref:Heterokaryon incompatibility domain-containing protein n=1 Tax=Fusarium heterosporum TaxID=42747 RepID=A0A8H5TCJ9_FUSHE|nr:hypothetical protein FHETE_5811 [Fusarium heterosporum]
MCAPALEVPSQLPTLPEWWQGKAYVLEYSSTPYFVISKDASPAEHVGLSHHMSLDSLSSSANDCSLCKIILQKVQDFIRDYEQMRKDPHKRYFTVEGQGHSLPDEWAFRLVQRLDGADGFLVSFEVDNDRGRKLYLINAFGFCVEPEESMFSVLSHDAEKAKRFSAGHLRGARVTADAGAKKTLDIVRGWINNCIEEHELCRPPRSPLPSRILDLTAFDNPDTIRLEVTGGTISYEPYVTLSYCWGSDPLFHVRTTRSTLMSHLRSIEIHTLPQTYQDAIKVTRHLGVRYLWIDSLCICQDDADDWARESATMQRVYAGAYASISADSAASSAHGFLKRLERTHIPITLKMSYDTDATTAPSGQAINVPGFAFETPPSKVFNSRSWLEFNGEPLTTRAWVTQERLLPQRVLHFASDQLFFECNCHFLSEDGVQIQGRWHSLRPGVEKTFRDLARASRTSAIHQLWYLILEDYTCRLLTVKTDRLPAISGLAAVILEKLNAREQSRVSAKPRRVEYVAGIWSDALIEGLGWTAMGSIEGANFLPRETPLPGEQGYIAPTWSPASFNGMSGHGTTMPGWVDVAVPIGYSVTPRNAQNPLGKVIDGWISLQAPMIKLELSELPDEDEDRLGDYRRNMRLCTPRGSRYGAYSSFDGFYGQTEESRSWVKSNSVFALVLSAKSIKKATDTEMLYTALLVIPANQERRVGIGGKEFRRVGRIMLGSECLGDDEAVIRESCGFAEVVIV